MKALRNKLKSRGGESIAEVLIALLIISISVMLFTEAVTVSGRIIQRGKETAKDYIAAENTLAVAGQSGGEPVTASLDFDGTSAEVDVNVIFHDAGSGNLYTYDIGETNG